MATTVFVAPAVAANPSANLDQCANDPAPSPSNNGCHDSATQWVNGNLGASKSVYQEGDSIPYRLVFANLSAAGGNSHTVTIEWDTTKSSKHAIDYITTWNRSVTDSDPCLGVTPCASPTTFAIPKDPQVDNGSGSPITQAPGVFTMWGGTITAVSAPAKVGNVTCGASNANASYCYSTGTGFTGDKSAAIKVTFTATQGNPVLAWGGHIAQRRAGGGSGGWGDNNSAISISGSPYHTRLIDLDGSGGSQDRSLSADAVVFPGSITIIKDATPNGNTSFGFTATPTPLANFSLVDDGTTANTKVFTINAAADFKAYSVSEDTKTGWNLTSIVCGVTSANGGSATVNLNGRSVSINLKEGENRTCTFSNSPVPAPHLTITKVATETGFSAVDDVIHYTITATNDGNVTLAAVTVTDPNASGLTCTPANGSSLAPGASMSCTASHTITQADIDAGEYFNQACVDDGAGGAAQACDDVTTPGDQNPHLAITKDATEASYDSTSDTIHYTIVATNDGNTTLAAVTVTDTEAVLGTCTPANGSSLAPGASMTCAASHAVTQADIDAGTYNNTACVDDGDGGAAEACDDADVPAVQNDVLTLTKSDNLNPAKYDHVGQVVTFTLTAKNEGNTTLHNVSVSDAPALDGFSCTPSIPVASLAPGASVVCTGTHTITSADMTALSFSDTASATSDEDNAPDADDTIFGVAPSITAQITPTNTNCNTFAAGTSGVLSQVQYSVKSGKINQVNPGVFFYWIKVSGGGSYTVTQTATPPYKTFTMASGTAVFNASCSKVNATFSQNSAGAVTVTFSGSGTFYIGIKYDTGAVVGQTAPANNGSIHYTFETTGIAGSAQSIDLVKK